MQLPIRVGGEGGREGEGEGEGEEEREGEGEGEGDVMMKKFNKI